MSSTKSTFLETLYQELSQLLTAESLTYELPIYLNPLDTAYLLVQQALNNNTAASFWHLAFKQSQLLLQKEPLDTQEHNLLFWMHVLGFTSNLSPKGSLPLQQLELNRLFLGPAVDPAAEHPPTDRELMFYAPLYTEKNTRAFKKNNKVESLLYQLYFHLNAFPAVSDLPLPPWSALPEQWKPFWKDLFNNYTFDKPLAIAFFFHCFPKTYPAFQDFKINKDDYHSFFGRELMINLLRRYVDMPGYAQSFTEAYLSSGFFKQKANNLYQPVMDLFYETGRLRRLEKITLSSQRDLEQKLKSTQTSLQEKKAAIGHRVSRFITKKETMLQFSQGYLLLRSEKPIAASEYTFEVLQPPSQQPSEYQQKLQQLFKTSGATEILQQILGQQKPQPTLWYSDGEMAFYFLLWVFHTLHTLPAESHLLFFHAGLPEPLNLSASPLCSPVLKQQEDAVLSAFQITSFQDVLELLGWFESPTAKPSTRLLAFFDFLELASLPYLRYLRRTSQTLFNQDSPCLTLASKIGSVLPDFTACSPQVVSQVFQQVFADADVRQTLQTVGTQHINYPFFPLEIWCHRASRKACFYFLHPFGLENTVQTIPLGFLIGSMVQTEGTLLPLARQIYNTYLEPFFKISVYPVVHSLMLDLLKQAEKAEKQHADMLETYNEVHHLVGVESSLNHLYQIQQMFHQNFIRLANQIKPGSVGMFSLERELAWLFKTNGEFWCQVRHKETYRDLTWLNRQYCQLRQGQASLALEHDVFSILVPVSAQSEKAFRIQTYHNPDQISVHDTAWQKIVPLVCLAARHQKLEFLQALLLASQIYKTQVKSDHEKRIFWTLKYMLHRPYTPHWIDYQGTKSAMVHCLQLVATCLEVKLARHFNLRVIYTVPQLQIQHLFEGAYHEIIKQFLNQDWLFFNCHWSDKPLAADQIPEGWQSAAWIKNHRRSADLLEALYQLALDELVPKHDEPDQIVLQEVQILRLTSHLQIRLTCSGLFRPKRLRHGPESERSGLSNTLAKIAACVNMTSPETLSSLPSEQQVLEQGLSICLDQAQQQTLLVIQLPAPQWLSQQPQNLKAETQATQTRPSMPALTETDLPEPGKVQICLINGTRPTDASRLARLKLIVKSPILTFEADDLERFQNLLEQLQLPRQNTGAFLFLLHTSAWGMASQRNWLPLFEHIHPDWKPCIHLLLYSGGRLPPEFQHTLQGHGFHVSVLHNFDQMGKTGYDQVSETLLKHLQTLEQLVHTEPVQVKPAPWWGVLTHLQLLLENYLEAAQKNPADPKLERLFWFPPTGTQPSADYWFRGLDLQKLQSLPFQQWSPAPQTQQFLLAVAQSDTELLPADWQQRDFQIVRDQIRSWLAEL